LYPIVFYDGQHKLSSVGVAKQCWTKLQPWFVTRIPSKALAPWLQQFKASSLTHTLNTQAMVVSKVIEEAHEGEIVSLALNALRKEIYSAADGDKTIKVRYLREERRGARRM
jgi:hypothetical protein